MYFSQAQFKHAEYLLDILLHFKSPADGVISHYFRTHKEIGAKDRAFVAEMAYVVLRKLRLLSAACPDENPSPRLLLFAALLLIFKCNVREVLHVGRSGEEETLAHLKAFSFKTVSPAVLANLPDWLFDRLKAQWRPKDGDFEALLASLNENAPFDLRVNPLKTTREAALLALNTADIPASATPFSPLGIRLDTHAQLSRLPLFLEGAIEVQDEGSQLLGLLLAPKRGEMVADFCAGAGGKTLLLGALMRSQGSLYAFDVSEKRLARFKPRLARSGLSNVHPILITSETDQKVKRLSKKFDRVLVDAPCSGLGTLRRNPDLKWRQTEKDILELTQKQSAILASAAYLLKKGGRLVYATCSLLEAENEAIVTAFLNTHPDFSMIPALPILEKVGVALPASEHPYLHLAPHTHHTDGFFAAVLEKNA